jgi:hypothetical protein
MDIKDSDVRDPAAARSRADEGKSRLLSETSPFFVDITEQLAGQGFAILGLGPVPPATPESQDKPLNHAEADRSASDSAGPGGEPG